MKPLARSDPAKEALYDALEALAESLALLEEAVRDWLGTDGLRRSVPGLTRIREALLELRTLLIGDEDE